MKLKKLLRVTVTLYLLAILLTGIVPFCIPRSVTKSFAETFSLSDFFGDAPCVDRVALVESPQEGFDTRIHILDEATERIDVSYYAMHMGDTTDRFLGALLDAADRGVQIRILVDGQFGGLTACHRAYASAIGCHPNITLKLYNPPRALMPWTWNGRLHDKYIIVDNRLLLLGGRNIGDKYFAPEGYSGTLSYDRDVLVYNTAFAEESGDSVVYGVRAYLDGLWEGKHVKEPFSKKTKKGIRTQQTLQEAFHSFRQEHESLFDHTSDDYDSWTYETNRVAFFHNDTGIGVKRPYAGYILGQLLRSAEQSVTLQSPYVILDSYSASLLKDLGEIETSILTNSPAASPNPMACAAYLGDRKAILDTGICLWEYQSPHTIHAKSYLIDNRMAVVGSFNLDPRSDFIDTELLLAIDSEAFSRHLADVQLEYRKNALQVAPDGSYLPGQAKAAAPLSLPKQLMLCALRPVARLLKGLT